MAAPPGSTTAPTRRNHVNGGKDTAVSAALRRRADAARRHPALEGRHGDRLAAHDPALSWPPAPRTPSTYGMTPDEIRHEAERLLSAGWGHWEIRCTLVDPEMVVAQ